MRLSFNPISVNLCKHPSRWFWNCLCAWGATLISFSGTSPSLLFSMVQNRFPGFSFFVLSDPMSLGIGQLDEGEKPTWSFSPGNLVWSLFVCVGTFNEYTWGYRVYLVLTHGNPLSRMLTGVPRWVQVKVESSWCPSCRSQSPFFRPSYISDASLVSFLETLTYSLGFCCLHPTRLGKTYNTLGF